MDMVQIYVATHWFSLLAVAGAVVSLIAAAALQFRRPGMLWPLFAVAAVLGLCGIGGLVLPFHWAIWVAAAAALGLFAKLLVLITSGEWLARLAVGVAAVFMLGLGGLAMPALGQGVAAVARTLLSLEAVDKWWLLLLGLVPVIIWLSYRSLAGLGNVRRVLAIGLRCALVVFLTLALAEVRVRHQNENLTVLFLVDRSMSIPEDVDFDPEAEGTQARIDRRWERIRKLINESVDQAKRKAEHLDDQTGVIVFGRRPRLEIAPTNTNLLNFREVLSPIDSTYTDIGAAIKLALASFPEGTGKRVVLLSDGNENLGNAVEQAQLAKQNGVQIDIVPLAAGYRNTQEILVESVQAPPVTEQGTRVPVRVLIRSYNPNPVVGELTVRRGSEGVQEPLEGMPMKVRVQPGLNSFTFKQPLAKTQQSYTYEAVFVPQLVENTRGQLVARGLAQDRVQNNRATTHVVARGQRRVLLVEQNSGDHQLLLDRLRLVAGSKYQLHAVPVDRLPANKEELGVFLSNYDCVLLANLPAETLTDDQQEMIRSNTHDQGCGLVKIGGPDSFGAGGWQQTPIEKALPVDCDIHSLKIQGKGGLVLIMHASEMAEGNFWQKQIAKLAINKLGPVDHVGLLQLDPINGRMNWHIPMQEIANRRERLLAQVDKMMPGDMPDFDPGLVMAHAKLTEAHRGLATKHVIIISDGDPMQTNPTILGKMRADKVTVTTVGVATHGASEDSKMQRIAQATGGRFHKVMSPKALPAIYIKETRLVSQSFTHEKPFNPQLRLQSGPTENLAGPLPPLHGFVRTSLKQSPLVDMLIEGVATADQQYPVLAAWPYGLGRSVAFTSDARSLQDGKRLGWDQRWAESEMYGKFWEQVIDWALRPVETGKLVMTTEYRDGRVRVTLDARDGNNRPLTDLRLRGGLTLPNMRSEDAARAPELRFEQKQGGVYVTEFKADEAGSYFINAVARRTVKVVENGKEVEKEEVDSVRSGVTIPYSPEFADLEGNAALLEKLREITGGQKYEDEPAALAAVAQERELFRPGLPSLRNMQPIWYWLVFLTGVFLFFDVAVRRIALEPAQVTTALAGLWQRLRREPVAAETPQYFERLKSRKAAAAESLEPARATRRFESGAGTYEAPAGADEATARGPALAGPKPEQPSIAPKKEEEATDYASRLLQAKKRARKDHDRET